MANNNNNPYDGIDMTALFEESARRVSDQDRQDISTATVSIPSIWNETLSNGTNTMTTPEQEELNNLRKEVDELREMHTQMAEQVKFLREIVINSSDIDSNSKEIIKALQSIGNYNHTIID